MKNLLFIAAAAAAMAACTKTGTVYEETGEIGLSPVNYTITKGYGAITGTTYPKTESFGVFACHTTADATEDFTGGTGILNEFLDGVKFVNNAGGATWKGVSPYYWPKTGSLYFACFSPYDAAGTKDYSFDRTTPKFTITDFVQGSYAYVGTPGITAVSGYEMADLMYTEVTQTSANSGAPAVTFKHALSYLTFVLKCNDKANGLFAIKSVTLKGIMNKGSFDSSTSAWTPDNRTAAEISLYTSTGTDQELSNNTSFNIDNVLIIPQKTQEIEIVYTQRAGAGQNPIQHTYTAKLKGGDTDNDTDENWLVNKHYTYNITFSVGDGTDEIQLTPSIEDWANVEHTISAPDTVTP